MKYIISIFFFLFLINCSNMNNNVSEKVNLDKYFDKHDDFETIIQNILTNNDKKPYPDINNFPED